MHRIWYGLGGSAYAEENYEDLLINGVCFMFAVQRNPATELSLASG